MSKLVVALDRIDPRSALDLAARLGGHVWGFKVRLPLLLRGGDSLLQDLLRHGKLMVDPKLYDIASSMQDDVQALHFPGGVDVLTVHASAGKARLRAALQTAGDTLLAAVTVLTDYTDEDCQAIYGTTRERAVIRLATVAREAGIPALVCAASDVPFFKSWGLQLIVPGFRPEGRVEGDDQVHTAGYEVGRLADLVVVGRPITRSDDPVAEADKLNKGLASRD